MNKATVTAAKGRPPKYRVMLNGMLWIARSGSQWRDLPEYYGKWEAVYARFCKWRDDGFFEQIFRALSALFLSYQTIRYFNTDPT